MTVLFIYLKYEQKHHAKKIQASIPDNKEVTNLESCETWTPSVTKSSLKPMDDFFETES